MLEKCAPGKDRRCFQPPPRRSPWQHNGVAMWHRTDARCTVPLICSRTFCQNISTPLKTSIHTHTQQHWAGAFVKGSKTVTFIFSDLFMHTYMVMLVKVHRLNIITYIMYYSYHITKDYVTVIKLHLYLMYILSEVVVVHRVNTQCAQCTQCTSCSKSTKAQVLH